MPRSPAGSASRSHMSVCHRIVLALSAPTLLAVGACRPGGPPAPGSDPPGAREVTLRRDLSITGIAWVVEIREDRRGGPASGAMRVTTGDANRRAVESGFGCQARADGPAAGRWTCAVTFRRGAP